MEQTHVCRRYRNARGEMIDPATQSGIGCRVCCPPDGRIAPPASPTKEDTNAC